VLRIGPLGIQHGETHVPAGEVLQVFSRSTGPVDELVAGVTLVGEDLEVRRCGRSIGGHLGGVAPGAQQPAVEVEVLGPAGAVVPVREANEAIPDGCMR
jgi:hypothetical protein